ncbi:MAG: SDR family NAD(P)-dependent oxidoreductase [Candidatus Brocadiia bacterium]
MSEKTAIITGGSGNLGKIVSERFLKNGYEIFIPWHKSEGWQELSENLSEELRERCRGRKVDLRDEDDVEAFVQEFLSEWGRIDVLLNLVGGFAFGNRIWETGLTTWNKMFELNVTTAFLCCKHVLPVMREQNSGRIVNVTSKACEDIQSGSGAYAVAKGAVITLTRAIHEEVKNTNIAVNAIMPSIIDTPATRDLMPHEDWDKWVKPEDIAEALLALCSEEGSAVSGSVIRLFGSM